MKKAPNGTCPKWIEAHKNYQGQECLIWPFSREKTGYARTGIVDGYKVTSVRVHRIMCEHKHGPCPKGMETLHICKRGHLGCVNPNHLKWGTKSENMTGVPYRGHEIP